ncbi:hypothetical protein C8F04DRAFT_1198691 [Mycena alexandri]|uniref:Uncharacterized protein n=1 Tax=Mycena alexandri TaxID=1745969 RepID=A0AAD6WP86_9AGAR|nr:hypothetical protein C8F04DRAFT_1198691 [Mycena alexandri]
MAATASTARSKPGVGDFSDGQNKRIDELYKDLLMKCGSSGSTEVQAWIDRTAKELFEEAVFADRRVPPTGSGILRSAADDPKLHQATTDTLGRPLFAAVDWIALIKKKIGNWKKKREVVAAIDQYRQSTAPTGTPSLISTASSPSATFFGRQPVTAREIYAREHEAEIKSAANEAKLQEGGNSAQHYQATLKQKWDALPSEEKEVYAAHAHSEAWDVEANQEVFKAALYRELSHICNSGMMGQIVIGCVWAMREPTGKLISADVIAGTNESNTMDAVVGADTWKTVIAAFRNMAQKELPGERRRCLPRPLPAPATEVPLPSLTFECNAEGIPIFPHCDMNAMPIKTMKVAVKAYLTKLWNNGRATEEPVNWDGLAYDQTVFSLPSKLENPDAMTWQIGALMEYFMDQKHPPFVLLRAPISDDSGNNGDSGGSGDGPKDGEQPPKGNAGGDNDGSEGDMPGDIGGKGGMNDDAPGDQDSDKDHDEDDAPAAKDKPIGAKSTAKKVKDSGKPKPKPKPKAAAKPAAAKGSANVEEPTDQVEEPTDDAHRPKQARKTKTRAEPLSPISKEAKEAAKKKEANKRNKSGKSLENFTYFAFSGTWGRPATAKTVRMGQRLFERLDQGQSRAPRVPLPARLVASPSFTNLDWRDVGNASDLLHYALEILGPANAKPSVDDRGIGSPPPRPRESLGLENAKPVDARRRSSGGRYFAPSSRNYLSLTQLKFMGLNRRDPQHAYDLPHHALNVLGPANAKPNVDARGPESARREACIAPPPPRPRKVEPGEHQTRCRSSRLKLLESNYRDVGDV